MRSLRFLAAVTVGIVGVAGTAVAGGISSGYAYTLNVGVGGNTYTLDDLDTTYTHVEGVGGTYTLNAPAVTPFGTITDWGSSYLIDPQVTNNFTVVNTTLIAQIFTVSVTSPIAPVLPTSLMRGSIGITLTDEGPLDGGGDTDGSASLSSALAQATYRAFLDGVEVQQLFPDPYTQSCAVANCSVVNSDDFGIPVRIPGPGATLTMGITVQFLLSPGDSASVTSVFNIIPVPEPSTAGMLALGLLGLAVAGRRRRA